jgi:hypothetical protein
MFKLKLAVGSLKTLIGLGITGVGAFLTATTPVTLGLSGLAGILIMGAGVALIGSGINDMHQSFAPERKARRTPIVVKKEKQAIKIKEDEFSTDEEYRQRRKLAMAEQPVTPYTKSGWLSIFRKAPTSRERKNSVEKNDLSNVGSPLNNRRK